MYDRRDPIGLCLSSWRNRKVLKSVKGHLVDIACGDNRLVKSYGSGTGVDVKGGGSADLVVDNFASLPFNNQSVDTVTIIASLNYFENLDGVLKEVRRILKDDGQLILTMANSLAMRFWHKVREPWAIKSGYTEEEIKTILRESNFKVQNKKSFMCHMNYIYIAHKNN